MVVRSKYVLKSRVLKEVLQLTLAPCLMFSLSYGVRRDKQEDISTYKRARERVTCVCLMRVRIIVMEENRQRGREGARSFLYPPGESWPTAPRNPTADS